MGSASSLAQVFVSAAYVEFNKESSSAAPPVSFQRPTAFVETATVSRQPPSINYPFGRFREVFGEDGDAMNSGMVALFGAEIPRRKTICQIVRPRIRRSSQNPR